MSIDPGTWTCHICKDERPDRFISVRKHERLLDGRFPMTENVRYCNDRLACIAGAETFRFIPDPPES